MLVFAEEHGKHEEEENDLQPILIDASLNIT
jgi:hypothetical protein